MMDVKIAARETGKLIELTTLPILQEEYGKAHLCWMMDKITGGEVIGEKAHRWLGYLQCAVVIGGGATLEQVKMINKRSKVK